MKTFGELFQSSITALDEAGLDTVKLVNFMDKHVEEDYSWPEVLIREFFNQRVDELTALCIPMNKSIFLQLGVRPDALDKMWSMYEEVGELWTAEMVLTNYFVSVVKLSDYTETSSHDTSTAADIGEDHLKATALSVQMHNRNVEELIRATGPIGEFQVRSGGLFEGTFSTKSIPIFSTIQPNDQHFYHSTSLENAASIIQNGPFSPASDARADFDGAFYLNKSSKDAMLWAEKVAKSSCRKLAVVLIYRVTAEYLSSLKVLLPTSEQWTKLVHAFRARQYNLINLSEYSEYDVVIGKKCKNPRDAFSKKLASAWVPQPQTDQDDQVAFSNVKEASKLKHHLIGITIYRL